MKKLALALVSSAFVMSATQANIGTGFYAGAMLGHGSTSASLKFQQTLLGNPYPVKGTRGIGGSSANFGLMAGYGAVLTDSFYLGGELGYTFSNDKITSNLDAPNDSSKFEVKRSGYFTAALRGGYLLTPNTMAYVRLGINAGKWSVSDNYHGNFGRLSNSNAAKGSSGSMTFAPGLGLETALTKNILLRVEYTCEFVGGITAKADVNNAAFKHSYTKVDNIRTHSGKIGISYKF